MTPHEPDPIHRPYCLRCYAPLESSRRASVHCETCGFLSVKEDQRLYWTREPKLIETEWLAKVGIVLLLGLFAYAMARGYKASIGMGQGWAIGFPILVGAILWETASKITRKKPYFRASLVWTVLPLVFALPFAVLLLWPADVTWGWRAGVAAFAGFFLALSYAARRAGVGLERWKERRILAGQSGVSRPASR